VSIKVLVADDSDVMRTAIRRVLNEDNRIEIVGEASAFAQTMLMTQRKSACVDSAPREVSMAVLCRAARLPEGIWHRGAIRPESE
jgi:chemotaxis response regulator CheB